MTRSRPSTVRFYVDADLLGAAKILAALRPDVTFPGDQGAVVNKRLRPACPISSPATKDTDWIPQVSGFGWVIITRDRRIQERRLEIDSVLNYGAKMVNLSSADADTRWNQLEVIFSQWRKIEDLVNEQGPFI